MEDEGVPVTTVADEMEADVVCGLLRSAGIECGHRVTDETDSLLHGIASDGPREILVHESDLETARALLADAQH
jgi:Putative prokaryotic signal transducing protein